MSHEEPPAAVFTPTSVREDIAASYRDEGLVCTGCGAVDDDPDRIAAEVKFILNDVEPYPYTFCGACRL